MREHTSAGSLEPDEDGWFTAECSCGYGSPPLPDLETLVDDLMWHAVEMEIQRGPDAGQGSFLWRPEGTVEEEG